MIYYHLRAHDDPNWQTNNRRFSPKS